MRRLVQPLVLFTIGAIVALSGSFAQAATASSVNEAPILSKTKAECAADYKANIETIKANGQSKAAFDADCRAGTEKIKPAAKP
jgi:hypothetical protein